MVALAYKSWMLAGGEGRAATAGHSEMSVL
jgi:hypothetical protein